jgi:hypothetical protein
LWSKGGIAGSKTGFKGSTVGVFGVVAIVIGDMALNAAKRPVVIKKLRRSIYLSYWVYLKISYSKEKICKNNRKLAAMITIKPITLKNLFDVFRPITDNTMAPIAEITSRSDVAAILRRNCGKYDK